MTTRRLKDDRPSLHERVVAGTAGGRGLEDPLRAARDRLDKDVGAWIAELRAAHTALGQGLDPQEDRRLSEVRERLERLEETLRQAPGQIVEHLRPHTSGLREVRERFETAFDNAPIGMALIAMDGRWLQVNDALCRITGHTEAQLKATTLRAMTHPDDVDLDAQSLAQLLAGRISSYHVEKRCRHAWGHDVWVLVTASMVRDEDGSPLHMVTQVQDISERKDLARRLEYLVDHDSLTGLFNRRHFEKELAKEAERASRYGTPGAVLLIDLDDFKYVNDTFGHRSGDDVLKGVAGMLRLRLRHTDIVARVGGDEFAALLTETDADRARLVADEVVQALSRETAVLADQTIRITVSIGIAMFDGSTDVEVMACADVAMYEAKETGRNRYAMYRPGEDGQERVSTRVTEADRIRLALEENRLILYCQPILDLGRNEISQYEILLRLPQENSDQLLPPSAFLYVAERAGLIQAIDDWVVGRAIELIAEHARAGIELVLNVNLSGKSIVDSHLAVLIEEGLARTGIDPARLILELTEAATIANMEVAKAFATRLRGRGCKFALDDFGAGVGSFYFLRNFPFDYLKIDGHFVRGLAASPMDRLVVESIVGIARGMGKKTIAEFVADEESARLLCAMGVDFAQGYHIGVPRPIAEVLQPAG